MGIVQRGSSSWSQSAAGGSTVYTMGMPAVASGDLILWLGDPVAKGLNPTAGYTYIVGSGTLTDGNAVQVYRKVSVGADSGTLSMTSAPFLGTKDLDALVLTFSGVDNTTPIDVHSNGSGTTNTSLTATSRILRLLHVGDRRVRWRAGSSVIRWRAGRARYPGQV